MMRFRIPAGLCLLALATGPFLIVAAAAPMRDGSRSSFESRLSGAVNGESRGRARFGVVEGDPLEGRRFSLELGAGDEGGAIIFSRVGAGLPEPGIYRVASHLGASSPEGFSALIVTGPADDPHGVFWARSGTLTITSSANGMLRGTFSVDAVGFLAADPRAEDRRISMAGTFEAEG